MAEFNPSFKVAGDPSYIGFSKERSGSTAVSGLISDLGGAAIGAVVAKDEDIQEEIKKQIQEAELAQEQGSAAAKVDAAEPATSTTEGQEDASMDLFGTEQTSANPEIQNGAKRAQRLTQAYRQGKVTPTQYWGQMSALNKSLKARYAGYEAVIDRQFQGVTGHIPANALAQAQRKEYLKGVATAASEEKQFNSFIKTNIQYLPGDYFDRIKAGTPYSQLETYSHVHKVRSRDHQQDEIKDNLAISAAQGNLNEEDAIGSASNTLNVRADAILNETATAGLIEGFKTAHLKGAKLSPQEKEQARVAFGQLKLKVEDALESELRKPTSDGKHTYYSLIKDPGKVKAIREQAMSRLNFVEQLLEDDQYGMLGATMNHVKATQDDATAKLFASSNYWAFADAANKNGGGPLIAKAFADPTMDKVQTDAGKALINLMNTKTVAGTPEASVEKLKTVMQLPKASTEEKKAVARTTIQNDINAIISPDATNVSAVAAAESLYGPGNSNFLQHLPASQQPEYYAKFVSPPVTKKMADLRSLRPDLWDRYRDWAKGSFLALQRTNAASVQEGIGNRENIDVTWDSGSNQFVTKLTEAGKEAQRKQLSGRDSLISGVEEAFQTDSERAVRELNKQIKVLENVLKVDGKNVSQEIATLLGVLDINPMTPKSQTLFQKLRKALDTELNPPEKASD